MSADKIIVIGHKSPDTDSICSALGYAAYKQALGVNAEAGMTAEPNKETMFALEKFGVVAPELVTSVPAKQKLILVDHNEEGQAVDGMRDAEIVEIIDHHRLGGISTASPLFVHIEPVGCTATIIANMFWKNDVKMSTSVAGLLLSAILSDTVLFKSPTCTQQDKDTAAKLAEEACVDLKEYGMAMLKAGAGIDGMTPDQVADTDLKAFEFGTVKAIISQISVMDPKEVLDIKADLLAAMKANCQAKGVELALLMVTDIMNESTHLLVAGEPQDLVAKAFAKPVEDSCVYLPGVMSRKKQIVPPMTEAAK